MENERDFDTLLIIGVLKALKERELLTEEELFECIRKVERDEEDVKSSSILQNID